MLLKWCCHVGTRFDNVPDLILVRVIRLCSVSSPYGKKVVVLIGGLSACDSLASSHSTITCMWLQLATLGLDDSLAFPRFSRGTGSSLGFCFSTRLEFFQPQLSTYVVLPLCCVSHFLFPSQFIFSESVSQQSSTAQTAVSDLCGPSVKAVMVAHFL